jgi:17beta-estradiol 17-dehydrogenase / very-long-chain 3-oxoacyl-CoA reductase
VAWRQCGKDKTQNPPPPSKNQTTTYLLDKERNHIDNWLAIMDAIKDLEPAVAILGAIGLYYVSKAVTNLYKTFLRPAKNLKKLGEWAVVTGATGKNCLGLLWRLRSYLCFDSFISGWCIFPNFNFADGIGKAYCFALAKQGLNVMMISRTESKLEDVKKEIEAKYPDVTISYLVCDYSKFNKTAQGNVAKALKKLEVGVLINNVGVSYRYPMFFHELSDEEVQNLMTMNIDSTVWMTRFVLPGMVERKAGTIVNLSSGSAMYTLPLLAEYSGAKSFIEKFSRAINAEYSAKGITCQCQIPFYVATKLAKMRKSLMVPTPEGYVSMAIKWVGYPDAVASPFILHAIQGWVLDILPKFVVSKGIMSMHLATRKRGQKKDAKLAAEGKNQWAYMRRILFWKTNNS